MTRTLIQAAIVTILETVTDIGPVHNGIRWTIHEDEWMKNFIVGIEDQAQIRTWMVSRVEGGMAYGPSGGGLGTGYAVTTQQSLERYDFTIEGWASFKDDDTDTEFQALIDSVLDKFEANISLNSTAILHGPVNYQIDHQFFGNYFVHHVIFNMYALETSGISPS